MKIYTSHLKTIADLLTPVSVYAKLRDHFPNALLLESADYHNRSDSKSFICFDPICGFEARSRAYSIQLPGEEEKKYIAKEPREVYEAFCEFSQNFEATENPLPFNSIGLFGYTAYEAVQYIEDIILKSPRNVSKDNPDMKYQLFRFVLVFDHFKNELFLTQNNIDSPLPNNDQLKKVLGLLNLQTTAGFHFKTDGPETSSIMDDEYMDYVRRGVAHCKRGDVFQVVVSREFRQAFKGDDFNVYRSLRSVNPSPYLFYFDYGNFKIFGSSPESQLQVSDGIAHINPIAGTVLRGPDPTENSRRAQQLRNDPKENAEHVMLVDLARNDLSKHSADVKVDTYAELQYFSHVIHMVSKVSGKIFDYNTGLDIYADTFPAGTLSGAPKYRALQIIDENEMQSRNFYGGSIGFFGFDGSVNHAIIIRSMLSKNNVLIYQAGAGIVADSKAEGELQEVNNKVAALRKAIKIAETL
jgi:anthranilate synthase component 1